MSKTLHEQGAFITRANVTNTRTTAGGLVTFLFNTASTGGASALFEARMRPGAEPPPHFHEERLTIFYVLEGEMEIQLGDEVRTARSGDAALVPPRTAHTYKVKSPIVRFLVLMQPGAGIERYFEEISRPTDHMELPDTPRITAPPDPAAMSALAPRYGFDFSSLDTEESNG
jgi:quercetin dioxygenase-like cupin family protein